MSNFTLAKIKYANDTLLKKSLSNFAKLNNFEELTGSLPFTKVSTLGFLLSTAIDILTSTLAKDNKNDS